MKLRSTNEKSFLCDSKFYSKLIKTDKKAFQVWGKQSLLSFSENRKSNSWEDK